MVAPLAQQRRLATTVLYLTVATSDQASLEERALAFRTIVGKLPRSGGRLLLGCDRLGCDGTAHDEAASRLEEMRSDLLDQGIEGVEVLVVTALRAEPGDETDDGGPVFVFPLRGTNDRASTLPAG